MRFFRHIFLPILNDVLVGYFVRKMIVLIYSLILRCSIFLKIPCTYAEHTLTICTCVLSTRIQILYLCSAFAYLRSACLCSAYAYENLHRNLRDHTQLLSIHFRIVSENCVQFVCICYELQMKQKIHSA